MKNLKFTLTALVVLAGMLCAVLFGWYLNEISSQSMGIGLSEHDTAADKKGRMKLKNVTTSLVGKKGVNKEYIKQTESSLRPNILYLLADDLGYGDVEYNGGKASTPNINKMAQGPHSILLSRFYSGGPVCSPTRGTILTGRNHNRYCIWHADVGVPCFDGQCPCSMPLPTSEITLPDILKKEGYQTAIYGKWHVGDLQVVDGGNKRWPVSHPGMHGFDEWLVTERDSFSVAPNCGCYNRFSCTVGNQFYEHKFCRDYHYMDHESNRLRAYNKSIVGDSDFIVDMFEKFLKGSRSVEKPFFVILAFHDVHRVYYALEPFLSKYTSMGYKKELVHYSGAVSQLDQAIGRARHLLQEYNIAQNTLVWFSSDNGPQLYTPGSTGGLKGQKGTLFEGGIRVPAIIEWPAIIKRNRKSDYPVVTNDLLPTVCDILGIIPPNDRPLDGISILPFLQDKIDYRNSSIAFAFHIKQGDLKSDFHSAIMQDSYKLIIHYNNGNAKTVNLYDIVNDARETTDISNTRSDLIQPLKQQIEEFLQSVTRSATDIGCISTHDRRRTSGKCSCHGISP